MKDSYITLDDGRKLAYTDIGSPGGHGVFFFHGAPSSRLRLTGMEDQFADCGLRVISPDRPGYGGSSPQPDRSMADWPRDVAVLADELGLDRFVVAGHSSGGPYAVACAALLPDRVKAGIVLAGVTDMGWPEAWDDQLGHEIDIMNQPDAASAVEWCTEQYGSDGSGYLASESADLPEPDLSFLDDISRKAMVEAFRQGVSGFACDIYIQGFPWPFDPARITAPMEILHGEHDTMVPVDHSRHTAGLIPGSNLRILPDHGHSSILSEIPKTASELSRE